MLNAMGKPMISKKTKHTTSVKRAMEKPPLSVSGSRVLSEAPQGAGAIKKRGNFRKRTFQSIIDNVIIPSKFRLSSAFRLPYDRTKVWDVRTPQKERDANGSVVYNAL